MFLLFKIYTIFAVQNKTKQMETITQLLRDRFPNLEISYSGKTVTVNGIIQYKEIFRLCHEYNSVKEYSLFMLEGLTVITFL